MKRFYDWPTRLEAAIRERESTPFAWGSHDCCLAACDLIAAIAGEDPGAWFRGRYRSERGAMVALRRYLDVYGRGFDGRGKTLAELLAAAVPVVARGARLEEIKPSFAGRGDVVLIAAARAGVCPDDSRLDMVSLAIIDLDGRSALAADTPGTIGWVSGPLAVVKRAWRIP